MPIPDENDTPVYPVTLRFLRNTEYSDGSNIMVMTFGKNGKEFANIHSAVNGNAEKNLNLRVLRLVSLRKCTKEFRYHCSASLAVILSRYPICFSQELNNAERP